MRHSAKKALSLLLSLALTLALIPTAYADKSTTTNGSASIDQLPRTELYVVSRSPGSDYPTFGGEK